MKRMLEKLYFGEIYRNEEVDGILYPKIQVSNDVKDDEKPFGKYGRMRLNYLKEHKTYMYRELLVNGELMEHCHRVNDEANERAILLRSSILRRILFQKIVALWIGLAVIILLGVWLWKLRWMR